MPLLGIGGRSASWSANMSSNIRNVILPLLATRCHYWRVDLPVDLPIWALRVDGSWSADMSSNIRNVILPMLTTRYHYWGVDMSVDLPIWALTVEMSYCHSWPLNATTGGWGRSTSWSANMSPKSINHILPLLTTRSHYWGVDLPVDLPLWALTVEATWSASVSSNIRNVILPF